MWTVQINANQNPSVCIDFQENTMTSPPGAVLPANASTTVKQFMSRPLIRAPCSVYWVCTCKCTKGSWELESRGRCMLRVGRWVSPGWLDYRIVITQLLIGVLAPQLLATTYYWQESMAPPSCSVIRVITPSSWPTHTRAHKQTHSISKNTCTVSPFLHCCWTCRQITQGLVWFCFVLT